MSNNQPAPAPAQPPAPAPDNGDGRQQLIYTFLLDLIKIAGACGITIPLFLNQSMLWMVAGAIVTLISIVLSFADKRQSLARLQASRAMNARLINSLQAKETPRA